MATIHIGRAHIEAFGSAAISGNTAITPFSSSAWASPNLQSLRPSHSSDGMAEIKAQSGGQITGLIFNDDDVIECTFEFAPEAGTGTNTKAAAAITAGVPIRSSYILTSGFPVMSVGSFADALNVSSATSGSPWIYLGGWAPSANNEGIWMFTLPLKRYKNITDATVRT